MAFESQAGMYIIKFNTQYLYLININYAYLAGSSHAIRAEL